MTVVAKNIALLATCAGAGTQGDIHIIEHAALAWKQDKITWVGRESELPVLPSDAKIIDLGGRVVIPGLVDCHTHLVFGGWRANEFEQRALGRTYLEIARAGGGILSTVAHTRSASAEDLTAKALDHLRRMAELGITTVECKSGYGLELDCELKILRAHRKLMALQPLSLVSTFLGAHTFPAEYKERQHEYVELVIREMLPRVAEEKLAEFCDIFVEQSAFNAGQAREIMLAASAHGMRAKFHVDQLSASRGAQLAAELDAISADHLEHTDEGGIAALKASGTVAVTLPIATLYTRQAPLDGRAFIDAGVPLAVATDFNPGSAPSYHLPLAMMLSCTMNRLTPAEALKGATLNAARALGRESVCGSLEPGKLADLAVLETSDVNHWLYHFRPNDCVMTVKAGQVIYDPQMIAA